MGNLDSLRDWGHARDYVEMQWRMLQQQGTPEDFVIATGSKNRWEPERTSRCRAWLGGIQWDGEGLHEIGRRADTSDVVVRIDPRCFRPAS